MDVWVEKVLVNNWCYQLQSEESASFRSSTPAIFNFQLSSEYAVGIGIVLSFASSREKVYLHQLLC